MNIRNLSISFILSALSLQFIIIYHIYLLVFRNFLYKILFNYCNKTRSSAKQYIIYVFSTITLIHVTIRVINKLIIPMLNTLISSTFETFHLTTITSIIINHLGRNVMKNNYCLKRILYLSECAKMNSIFFFLE